MAYEEPKDPLTGKGNRHSTAALRSILGLSKAIIEEQESEPVVVLPPLRPIQAYQQRNRDMKIPSDFWGLNIENKTMIKWELKLSDKGIGQNDVNLIVMAIKGVWGTGNNIESWKVMYYWSWEKPTVKRIKGIGVTKYNNSNFIALEVQPDVKLAKKTIGEFKNKARLDDYKRFSKREHIEEVSKFLG